MNGSDSIAGPEKGLQYEVMPFTGCRRKKILQWVGSASRWEISGGDCLSLAALSWPEAAMTYSRSAVVLLAGLRCPATAAHSGACP